MRLVAYTPTESSQNPTLAQIFTDLESVRQLGFDGVKLWNTNELYQRGWLAEVLSKAESLSLRVNVVYQFNQTNDVFPPSESATDAMKVTIGRIASVTQSSHAVVWNSLFAPFDWNMTETNRQAIVRSQNYQNTLEELLATIAESDPAHQVRVSFDGDPRIGFPFLKNARGYGIMPYSLSLDDIDIARTRAFVAYFAPDGKPVYIDEWGLHTTDHLRHGRVSNEEQKARRLVEFARFTEASHLDWTYFMLIDRVQSISFERGVDWGLLNLDRTPRRSGSALASYLHAA